MYDAPGMNFATPAGIQARYQEKVAGAGVPPKGRSGAGPSLRRVSMNRAGVNLRK